MKIKFNIRVRALIFLLFLLDLRTIQKLNLDRIFRYRTYRRVNFLLFINIFRT